jgi:hypothetical protein
VIEKEKEKFMPVVTFNQMIELNEMLKNLDLRFKIHLRDACGGQSFWIEPLEESIPTEEYEKLYMIMESYFIKNRMSIVYTDDKINFTIK